MRKPLLSFVLVPKVVVAGVSVVTFVRPDESLLLPPLYVALAVKLTGVACVPGTRNASETLFVANAESAPSEQVIPSGGGAVAGELGAVQLLGSELLM
jgi:hypothetical protein